MNKTVSQRWQRRKAERPGEIINAALDLFVEKGYAATRLEEVARKAGVSKGTLYLYFDNKAALFKAVVRETVLPELERAENFVRDYQGSASELLNHMVYKWWQTVGETKLCGLPKLIIAEAGNFPEIARFYYDEVIVRARKLLADICRSGMAQGEFRSCHPDYAARTLISPLVFAAIWKTSFKQFEQVPFDINIFLEHHLDLFFNGIRKTEV